MELTEKHIELLEKQYFQQLSDAELSELAQLLEDPAFAEEASRYLAIFERISAESKAELKSNMNTWEEMQRKRPLRLSGNMQLLKVAAVLVVIVGAFLYVFNRSNSTNEISSFYEAFPNRLMVRTVDTDTVLSQALYNYDSKDYIEARTMLNGRTDESALFYKAHCSFNLGEYQQAIDDFKSVIDLSGPWKETSEWYILLAQLQLDDFNPSKNSYKNLQAMASSNHGYSNEAARLLELLRTSK